MTVTVQCRLSAQMADTLIRLPVSKMSRFSRYAGTTVENNVVIPLPPFKYLKRIVGVKGKSGIPRSNYSPLSQG